jgi:hypothetical protein
MLRQTAVAEELINISRCLSHGPSTCHLVMLRIGGFPSGTNFDLMQVGFGFIGMQRQTAITEELINISRYLVKS